MIALNSTSTSLLFFEFGFTGQFFSAWQLQDENKQLQRSLQYSYLVHDIRTYHCTCTVVSSSSYLLNATYANKRMYSCVLVLVKLLNKERNKKIRRKFIHSFIIHFFNFSTRSLKVQPTGGVVDADQLRQL